MFLNVSAPTNGVDRMDFLNILDDTVKTCSGDDFMFLGGDFNCIGNPTLDRNHLEPHPASCLRLRVFNSNHRQYTWNHARDNVLSLARLDRLLF